MASCAIGCGTGCGTGILVTLLAKGAFPFNLRQRVQNTDDNADEDVVIPVSSTSSLAPSKEGSLTNSRGRNIVRKKTCFFVDSEGMYELNLQLQGAGIDTSMFGKGTAKTLEELYHELNVTKESKLIVGKDGSLKRIVRVMSVELIVQDYLGQWHHLVSTAQFFRDGRQRNRRDVLTRKIHENETWEEAISAAFSDRVCFHEDMQKKHFLIDLTEEPVARETSVESQGFPGLQAHYLFYRIKVLVRDPTHADLKCLGLPDCRDFVTVKDADGQEGNCGTNLRMWAWEPCEDPFVMSRQVSAMSSMSSEPTWATSGQRARVPMPSLLSIASDTEVPVKAPNEMLRKLLAGTKTDWDKATQAATRIRDPSYSLKMFHDDCVDAFPELRLYLADSSTTTSGRTGGDEYQRTLGALFAVYWLMRVDLDGKEGFTFGVDAEWNVRQRSKIFEGQIVPPTEIGSDLCTKFLNSTDWSFVTQLFVNAGLLKQEPSGTLSVCLERTLAMLALTAIHDIMKVGSLLPIVQNEHSSFRGYAEGVTINDHDIALGYVLEKFPDLLPSFAGLPARQRKAIEFTQSKMDYNMGWLVQGEAPPGALFRSFKQLLGAGEVSSTDVSFYFVHWLTDLAGAEPYPLEGSEKFVLMIPHTVLHSFLRSFPVVQELAHASETEVFENYLCMRWRKSGIMGELPPVGNKCIAMLRLLCQAQGNAKAVLDAFENQLTHEERKLLGSEMARTGCADQRYARSDSSAESDGPAMLVYYAPALLQKFGGTEALHTLRRLCEVYRQARQLWPADTSDAGGLVTVRIDTVKDKSHQQLRDAAVAGNIFVLVRHNDKEAFVEMHSLQALNDLCVSMPGSFRCMKLI